jgi:LPS O-antigen subunit length determinant protein (WzzB/FepE family)
MKKNNTYLTDDDKELVDFIKSLWREKILILSISIICGLAGYLYASFQPQEFKMEIQLKNPPPQLFERYIYIFNNSNYDYIFNDSNNKNNGLYEQFINEVSLNFLSLSNVESFIEESREFDNFKRYLKSRNIYIKNYFEGKFDAVQKGKLIIPNRYFLIFTKELDGDIFLNNYTQFIKKKFIAEKKKNFKLKIENSLSILENALEKAKLINLENPMLVWMGQTTANVNENLFYRGSKILSHEINYLKGLLAKLENDQFDFEIVLDKSLSIPFEQKSVLVFFVIGIIFGLFLSLGIIFFKHILKNK